MRFATGRVIDGKVVVEGEPFQEGLTVAVLAPDGETVTLSSEERADLLEAIAEADAGDFVSSEQFLRELWGRD
jgi:DNA-binding winged helix-turn-helix (wHTH) protein